MQRQLISDKLCTGCGLCEGIFKSAKVEMKYSPKGYLRPLLKSKLNRSEKSIFKQICPGLNITSEKENPAIFHPIWGTTYDCFTAYSSEDQIIKESSSGGVISSILIYLIEKKIVDAVIHIGMNKGNPFDNEIKVSKTKEEILSNSNSRYSPSSPLKTIKELLDLNLKYAFVGKPCDVQGLKLYAKFDNRVNTNILYTLSFFCAGIPSIQSTYKLVEEFNLSKDEIEEIYYRKNGWPGNFHIKTKTKNVFERNYKYAWGQNLGRSLQFRCKICPDGIGELADISCADAWKTFDKKGFPSFLNDEGRSLVFIRSLKGKALMSDIILDKKVIVERVIDNLDEVNKIQPGQYRRKIELKYRLMAVTILLFKKLNISEHFIIQENELSNKKRIRALLGTIKRFFN